MASLTLTQFQTKVLRILGNIQTSHPVISDGDHTRAINFAANHIVRMYPDLFPEQHKSAATAAATVAGNQTIALPTNLLVLERVTRTESSSAPTLADTTEKLVAPSTIEVIGLLNKDTTTVGYPSLWAREQDNIKYHPTTRTGYTTYLVCYGLFGLTALSTGSDTFAINTYWDDPITFYAAARIAMELGWTERYVELTQAAQTALQETLSIMGVERAAKPNRITIAGMPR